MKKLIYLSAVLVLLFSLTLASCGGGGGSNGGNSSGNRGGGRVLDGYVIVRGSQTIDASSLKNAVKDRSGTELQVLNSWIGAGETEQEKEILIGDTGRAASTAALEGIKTGDYIIKQDGEKIVIVGGSTESTVKAMNYFIENCLSADGKSLNIPADGYTVRGEYRFDSLTIGGVPASEFKFYNAGSLSDGKKMFDWFAHEILGAEMETAKELKDGEHYIIYDDRSFMAYEFEIKVEDGNLVILGSFNTVRTAMQYFMETYIPSIAEKGKTYDITEADNVLIVTEEKEIYTKDQLYNALEEVYNDNERFIIGQEGGEPETADETMENFYKASGKYPALIGQDLGCYGLDLRDKDKSFWSRAICEYVDYAAQGGIITFSSHWRNPTGNFPHTWEDCRGELGHEEVWAELLTEGTELNAEFMEQITTDALFLQALRDNGVPIIWRPMHEQNGSFFWWCIEQEDGYVLNGSYFVNLWKYVYKYYTEDMGLDNLLWEFGPNKTNGRNYQDVLYCYPGDEYCDLVSLDWYLGGEYNLNDDGKSYERLMETGKITNLSEFGLSDGLTAENPEYQERIFNAMNLLEDVILRMVEEDGYKMAYLLTWTEASRDTIGSMMRADQLMNSGYIIDLTEMKEILDSYK
ncbi:MAG: hypothetical protein IJZ89_00305 [Clostridia bacterium]|nr:hypothetical protein [Clostridia bacterium]